ncbi:MAG: nitroreductase family protein [Prevotellaceae bacterium]|jgi:nitroreductase|nr:nitroreductase family protein [Prevotellaceae bacterium]
MTSFIELLKTRRSIRRFKAQAVESEKIEWLKRALLSSPTGKHANDWEFVFVQNKDMLAKLSQTKEHGGEFVARAPLAVVIASDTAKDDNTWVEDCSIAAFNLQLAAESMGLSSCWMQCRGRKRNDGSLCEDNVRALLNLPDNLGVLCIVAIGYKDEERKPFDWEKLQYEKIHEEKF